MSIYQIVWCFCIYACFGWCVEVAFAAFKERRFINRGFLNGPLCPIYGFGVVAVVTLLQDYKDDFLLLYLMSVVVATALEWVTGFLLEKLFHHRWWDYSDMPMNIQGYVCVPFSIAWGAACVFVVKLVHPAIFKMINWIPPLVGHILLGILLAVMAVDLCVTVNEILKLNRELKKMQEITEELQRLSVYLGENISKNVLLSMEKQEYVKEKVDDVKERVEEKADDLKELVEGKTDDIRERVEEKADDIKELVEEKTDDMKEKIEDMKEKYQKLFEKTSLGNRRILKAFPKMKSREYGKQLQDLKNFFEKKKTGEK
ncbi:MAG: hypothetical protein U0L12_10940 [Ruminococcus sp.]|nr:hypothetical protein [Ruminococcus sp.]